MSWFQELIKYVFGENPKTLTKISILVISLVVLLLVDHVFQFTQQIRTENKINNLGKLIELEAFARSSDTTLKKPLSQLRYRIINSWNLADEYSLAVLLSSKHPGNIRNIPPEAKANNKADYDYIFFILSTSGIFLFFALIAPVLGFFIDIKGGLVFRFGIGVLFSVFCIVLAFLFSIPFRFVPNIEKDSYSWNYVLNIACQLIAVSILSWITQRDKARRASKM